MMSNHEICRLIVVQVDWEENFELSFRSIQVENWGAGKVTLFFACEKKSHTISVCLVEVFQALGHPM
jgi:hypothetical protein